MKRLGLWCDLKLARRRYYFESPDWPDNNSPIFLYKYLRPEQIHLYSDFLLRQDRGLAVPNIGRRIILLLSRYISIYKITMRVGEYNKIAEDLCLKYSDNPSSTFNSISIPGTSKRIIEATKAPPFLWPREVKSCAYKRLKRRQEWVEQNVTNCTICNVKITFKSLNKSFSHRKTLNLSGSEIRADNYISKNISEFYSRYRTCQSCHSKARNVLAIMTEVESINSDVKILRKEINS